MSKEQQIFDMNCNDCKFLTRSFHDRQQHIDFHYQMHKNLFNTRRLKLIRTAERHFKLGNRGKGKELLKKVHKMEFIFDESSCSLYYGTCDIKKTKLSFIPHTVSEENINCFKHRSE